MYNILVTFGVFQGHKSLRMASPCVAGHLEMPEVVVREEEADGHAGDEDDAQWHLVARQVVLHRVARVQSGLSQVENFHSATQCQRRDRPTD